MKIHYKIFALIICITQASCGGLNTFHEHARAGDTVAVPLGMKPDFSKDNVTVTITPSSGADIVLNATDPAIRAVLNFYPDPVSNMIVSRETGEDLTPFASTYGFSTLGSADNQKDYFQTTLFLDLPLTLSDGSTPLPTGLTAIQVSNGSGTTHTADVNIIEGVGTPNTFNSDFNGQLFLNKDMLDSLSRAPHTTVSFAHIDYPTEPLPHAVELSFTHGSGQAFVINPLGYIKNLSWADDGTNMKIIMLQSKDGIIDDMKDYKFYISGSVTNLQLESAQGYGIDGNSIAVSPILTPSN